MDMDMLQVRPPMLVNHLTELKCSRFQQEDPHKPRGNPILFCVTFHTEKHEEVWIVNYVEGCEVFFVCEIGVGFVFIQQEPGAVEPA